MERFFMVKMIIAHSKLYDAKRCFKVHFQIIKIPQKRHSTRHNNYQHSCDSQHNDSQRKN
jgi:hypothetical protein